VLELEDDALPASLTAVREPTKTLTVNLVDLSKWVLVLVSAGCVTDILTTFIPWGYMGNLQWFLPLSIPIGWPAIFMDPSIQIWTIAIVLKLAILSVLGSLLFYKYSKNALFQLALLASIALSFAGFGVAFAHGMILSFGFYVVVISCFLKITGLALNYLEIEIVP